MRKSLSSNVLAAVLLLALAAGSARAADVFVDQAHPRAADTNPGTRDAPWRTIRKAAGMLRAGDTCWVGPGTYDETVPVTASGKPGAFVTFKAAGPVTVRGFQIESCSYVRIVGFEITQTAAFRDPAILVAGSDHCQILDNRIHHTSTIGIFFHKRAPSHHNIVRGNRMSFIGSVPGQETGEIAIVVAGDANIVEYNDVSQAADFTNVWGRGNIIRNNYFHDNALADFPDFIRRNPEGHHIDGLQYYSDAVAPLVRTVMEDNLIVDNDVPHGHLVLMRNVAGHPSSEFLFRRNVAVRNGAIAILIERFPGLRVVHNTFVDMVHRQTPKARYCLQITGGSTDAKVLNNIFVRSAHPGGMTIYVDGTSMPGFLAAGNLVESSGRPVQQRGLEKDPAFAAPAEGRFDLLERSPAVDAGVPLTTTVAAGEGTRVPVLDAGFFSDGGGITAGDIVRIGTAPPVRVLRADYDGNSIEIDRPISWAAKAPVSYDYAGKAPDIGGLERVDGRGETDVRIASPLPGAAVATPVCVRADVSDPADVRYVVFLADGIPAGQVETPPYEFAWEASGLKPGSHEIEARAYLRSAQAAPTRSARITVNVGPARPAPGGRNGTAAGTAPSGSAPRS
ncbi:MAG: right-handed parallel beta-helix repeat-containing protein [Acidobacteriota bacterium]